ncbi:MAG: hypothetical protein RLZZ78_399 [Armatimonadota bacterium]
MPANPFPTESFVLITGAAGQIGSNIASALRESGTTVRTTDLNGDVDIQADLTNFEDVLSALRGCTHVIHCGAIPSPIDGREHDVLASNAQGTWNVLQSCANLGIKRAVIFSSVNAFGSFAGRRPLAYLPGDDTYPVQTVNAYQLAKHLVETTAHHYARNHKMDIALLRPVYVASERSYASWRSSTDTTPNIWNISDLWSYVDLRDVVSAAILAATASFTGCHAMLLAANDTTTCVTTAELIERDYPDAEMTDRLKTWLSAENRYRGLIDCSAAKKVIGWSPRYSWRKG